MSMFTDADGNKLKYSSSLSLARCPHCGIARPSLLGLNNFETAGKSGQRRWFTHRCTTCGGVVLSEADKTGGVVRLYPRPRGVDIAVPERPREYLSQAQESLAQAAGSIMLSASAVDAMLKAQGYIEGGLYHRIDEAAEDHLITDGMKQWAHQVRLDANEQRHADEASPLPNEADAEKTLDFAMSLAEFLFVLPSRVTRGLKQSGGEGASIKSK